MSRIACLNVRIGENGYIVGRMKAVYKSPDDQPESFTLVPQEIKLPDQTLPGDPATSQSLDVESLDNTDSFHRQGQKFEEFFGDFFSTDFN